jgi:hypothetical protein
LGLFTSIELADQEVALDEAIATFEEHFPMFGALERIFVALPPNMPEPFLRRLAARGRNLDFEIANYKCGIAQTSIRAWR